MSFIRSWKKVASAGKLAVLTQLEYRLNYATDALIQPTAIALIEIAMWTGIFAAGKHTSIAGFGMDYYISYAIWASFIARVSANWMYEHLMIREVESGQVNSILVRPISFYEYFLGQFMGYKVFTLFISAIVPIVFTLIYPGTIEFSRLPLAFCLVIYNLIFVHTLSFCVASLAFFMTRAHSITMAKNIAIMIITGELFPLDMIPAEYRDWITQLPFASSVFIPVGYITQRHEMPVLMQGFVSTSIGILISGIIGTVLWNQGRKIYSGTGA